MSYQKQNFANGEVLSASQLNHIEDGIAEVESTASTSLAAEKTRAEQAEQALDTRTAALESCGFVVVDGKICVRYIKR